MILQGKMIHPKTIIAMLIGSAVLQLAESAPNLHSKYEKADTFGVDYYISHALEHNPRILASIDNVAVKKREAELASSLSDPMVMAKVNSEINFGIAAIGVSQMIMWPGKLLAMRKAGNHIAEAKEQELAAVMAAVEAEVRISYATLYSIGRAIERRKENLELLKISEQVARAQYVSSNISRAASTTEPMSSSERSASNAMGQMSSNYQANQMNGPSMISSINQSALLKIQVEQTILEDQINNAQIRADSERKRFRALLGANEYMSIPLPEQITSLQLPATKEEVLKAVQGKSPKILAMKKQLASAASMVTAARAGFFPDISVGIEYMPDSYGSMATSSMPISPSGGGNWEAGISISVPLWVGKKEKEIERAKKMESGMRYELEDMRNMVMAETEVLLNEIYDAERRIGLYRDVLVPQSKQVVDVVQASYRAGQNSYLDIIEGQRTLLNLQITLAEEQARREIAMAGIIRILGSRQWSDSSQSKFYGSEDKE